MINGMNVIMSFGEVLMLVVGICSIFVLVIMGMQKGRNALLQKSLDAMWKRIDENKTRIESNEKHVDRNFHNKDEVKEYIELVNKPYLQQIKNIGTKLDELTAMVKSIVEKGN